MSLLIDEDEINILRGVEKNARKRISIPPKKEINIDYSVIIPEDEKVQLNHTIQLDPEKYQDFTQAKFPYSLNFYDFEVFIHDWCVTIINPVENLKTIIANNVQALKRYYSRHKNQIWVGYNSRRYDSIVLKGIICGLNPKEVSDDIILRNKNAYAISRDIINVKLLDFDMWEKHSLKTIEGFMGNDIRESEVDFDIMRALTPSEMRQTVKYNVHDVEQTIEIFRKNQYLYDSQMQLIKTFGRDISSINNTQIQLAAQILECEKIKRDDEFDLQIVPTLSLRKYTFARDWFENEENMNYKNSFNLVVAGVPHQFGWGGLHGCPVEPLHRKGNIYHIDVVSYYPSIMLAYNFLTRNTKKKSKYKEIYDIRVQLKKEGKKKEQAPYKIVLNGAYGMAKDRYSLAYDPRQANNVVVNGQLLLLDLIEKLEPYIELIQSNTDGLIIRVPKSSEIDKVMRICKRWEERTKMELGFDEVEEIYQKDVNNYIFRCKNGSIERKGAYVMELNELNNDLPIVNKALVDYMMSGVPVEDTIQNCKKLKQFQKIVKVSSAYEGAWHNNEYIRNSTFRLYASKDPNDTYLGKYKFKGATIEKFANTPEHAFIHNEDVNGLSIPKKLDVEWYVNLAKKRLQDFGIRDNLFGYL